MSTSETIQKYAGAFIKGGLASIPGVGGFIVEMINVTIPNKRLNRVEKLFHKLSSRVSDIEEQLLEQKFTCDDFTDICEEVVAQSITANSDQRLEYLAFILEDGIRQEQIEFFKVKRLLKILDDVNDVEVILLQSYERENNSEGFRRKHLNVFDCSKMNPEKAKEHKVMLNNYESHLINLGLIGKSYDSIVLGLCITDLGVMLLKQIGVKNGKERLTGYPINAIDAINSANDELKQKETQIRREIEKDTQKAKRDIESSFKDVERKLRKYFK